MRDIITTNTFGCTAPQLARTGHSAARIATGCRAQCEGGNRAGRRPRRLRCARHRADGKAAENPWAISVLKTLFACSAEHIEAGAAAGADLVLIETMSDAYELKAAVLAAKECCDAPRLCHGNPLDRRGKLLTGGDIASIAALLEGLRVELCSASTAVWARAKMLPFLAELRAVSSLPILLQPNAGLPREVGGETVFDVNPGEFAALMEDCVRRGASLLGGCCGTTPAHIRALTKRCAGIVPLPVTQKRFTVASSYAHAVRFGEGRPVLIGERINPTGKPRMKQALRDGDYDSILREACSAGTGRGRAGCKRRPPGIG